MPLLLHLAQWLLGLFCPFYLAVAASNLRRNGHLSSVFVANPLPAVGFFVHVRCFLLSRSHSVDFCSFPLAVPRKQTFFFSSPFGFGFLLFRSSAKKVMWADSVSFSVSHDRRSTR